MTDLDLDFDLADQLVSARARRRDGAEPPHLDPTLERVRRGYYRAVGDGLTGSQQYELRLRATADARRGTLVFSHASAAHLWGCPLLRSDTRLVHATQPGKARKTTAGTQIHRTSLPDEHVVELPSGLTVTSEAWTAIQIAAELPLPNVLLPLDHLARLLNTDPVGDPTGSAVIAMLLDLVPRGMKRRSRAEAHLRLADPRSGSAGEALSRGQMALLHIPRPELQVRFPRIDVPGEDVVDFDWPELGVFGEFDGRGKYFREEMTGSRTPEEVLWDEKIREDRIRRHRPRAARWGWDVAMSRDRLAQVLAAAGVRPGG